MVLNGSMYRADVEDDLAHGQGVILAARWILVVSALALAIWEPRALGVLWVQIVLILGLAAANFFLHSQLLMRRPVLAKVVYAASAADIAVVSLIVFAAGGFSSGTYVFYFPALVAMSVAFRPVITLAFGTAAAATYGLISLPTFAAGDEVVLISRLAMLAAVVVCGSVYWRIERGRRDSVSQPTVAVDARDGDRVPSLRS